MPPQDFELGPAPVDPLDLSTLGGMPSVQQQAQRAPQRPQDKGEQRNWLKLALMLPVAMKAGPGAVEGLLQGWNEATQQRQETQRQTMLDQQAAAREQRVAMQQQQQLQLAAARLRQEQEARKVGFINDFLTKAQTLEDDEAARALLRLYQAQAPSFGVSPVELETTLLQTTKPSTLQKRAAEKRINALRAQYGTDWMQTAAKFKHVINGEEVTFDELLRRAGMVPDQAAQAAPQSGIALDVPLERQLAAAIASGNTELANAIEDAIRRQHAAQREPDTPELEWIIRNGQPVQIRKGTARAGDVPYDPQLMRTLSAPPTPVASAYSMERAQRTIQSVDELVGQVNRWTTGIGSILRRIPETDARNFAAELDTLKANIAFNELTAMREASKTGGALGQVSNIELGLLQSALGALDVGQSPANLREQLLKIKASVERWMNAVRQHQQTAAPAGVPAGTTTPRTPPGPNPFRRN